MSPRDDTPDPVRWDRVREVRREIAADPEGYVESRLEETAERLLREIREKDGTCG